MISMVIYIAAFAITAIFLNRAAYYYNIRKGIAQGEECFSHDCDTLSPCVKIYKLRQDDSEINFRKSIDLRVKYFLFFILSLLPLFLISALRYGIGTDYFYTYVPGFELIEKGENFYTEPGFNLLNKFILLFTNDLQWLFVITSFLFVFFFTKTIIRCSVNVTFSVVILYCTMLFFWSMNNVRQAVAAVLIFSSFPHLLKKHTVRFLIYTIIASFFFHITAIGMIFPYIISNIKLINKHWVAALIIAAFALPFIGHIFTEIVRITKYGYFLTDATFTRDKFSFYEVILQLIILVAAGISLRWNFKSRYGWVLFCLQFFAIYIIMLTFFIGSVEMFRRLMYYFQMFQCLLIPYCVRNIRRIINRAYVSLLYIVGVGLYATYLTINHSHEVVPYQWIFGN